MDRMTELSEKWKASALSIGEAEELITLFVASRDGVGSALDLVVKGKFNPFADCACCEGKHRYSTYLEREGEYFNFTDYVQDFIRAQPDGQLVRFCLSVSSSSGSGLSDVLHHVSQAREYLLMTPLHFDESAVGAEHLMHYIRMANDQIEKAISCGSV